MIHDLHKRLVAQNNPGEDQLLLVFYPASMETKEIEIFCPIF